MKKLIVISVFILLGMLANSAIAGSCVLQWVGRANDLKVSFCSYADDSFAEGPGCITVRDSKD